MASDPIIALPSSQEAKGKFVLVLVYLSFLAYKWLWLIKIMSRSLIGNHKQKTSKSWSRGGLQATPLPLLVRASGQLQSHTSWGSFHRATSDALRRVGS